MFLYPALTIGFLFVAVPLLVHLINMLRHRRQRWAAMDFLLASYRKQKKWIRLRQLLLLLSRLAVAAILIAMLCGWTGGGQVLGLLGGNTTHHVVVLDDSYSMGDSSIAGGSGADLGDDVQAAGTAYGRSLQTLQDLVRRLANDEGNHQLTVMRASRAALTTRGGSSAADAAADLSAQTIDAEARLINRLMSTTASPLRTDLVAALDLAGELIETTPADLKYLYVASDFRSRDWDSPERLAESMRRLAGDDVEVRMIDCAAAPAPNLAITSVEPTPDVWVAGVPVVIEVSIRNYSNTPARNVPLSSRVIRYPRDLQRADPTLPYSGTVESLPVMMIEAIEPGEVLTKSFQVYVTEQGTHAIEVSLPEDALAIDNTRSCTLPLSDVEKVLIIDSDPDQRGQYHVASVLDPGSQVRIGAIPVVQPPAYLRSISLEQLASYRAVYLIDLPEISESAAEALAEYVRRGGGLAWFLGNDVLANSYNRTLLAGDRYLLPAPLDQPESLPATSEETINDVLYGDPSPLTDPLRGVGDAALALLGVDTAWRLKPDPVDAEAEAAETRADRPRVLTPLKLRDGRPLVTQHEVGQGRVVTVLAGLDGGWTNWPGDPTFVVFLLQSNAYLWSGAAPPTRRFVDQPIEFRLPVDDYAAEAAFLPATRQPPRVPLEIEANVVEQGESAAETFSSRGGSVMVVGFDPEETVIEGQDNVDEMLRPGVAEWVFVRADGRGEVTPSASVIRVGEGDLSRADPAEIRQQLLPVEVKFVSSRAWSEQNRTAGSSTLTLLLLALLGTLLAGEQCLAYWASYHLSPAATSRSGGER